ncbi:MAG: hypothetical protein QXY40_03720 [Candidatus Methanomethylicia archaeon]
MTTTLHEQHNTSNHILKHDHIVWANIRYRLWWQVITGPEMHYTIYHLDPIYIEDHYLQATSNYRGIGPWPPLSYTKTIT